MLMQVNIWLWNAHLWQETLSPKQTCMLACGSPEILPTPTPFGTAGPRPRYFLSIKIISTWMCNKTPDKRKNYFGIRFKIFCLFFSLHYYLGLKRHSFPHKHGYFLPYLDLILILIKIQNIKQILHQKPSDVHSVQKAKMFKSPLKRVQFPQTYNRSKKSHLEFVVWVSATCRNPLHIEAKLKVKVTWQGLRFHKNSNTGQTNYFTKKKRSSKSQRILFRATHLFQLIQLYYLSN